MSYEQPARIDVPPPAHDPCSSTAGTAYDMRLFPICSHRALLAVATEYRSAGQHAPPRCAHRRSRRVRDQTPKPCHPWGRLPGPRGQPAWCAAAGHRGALDGPASV